MKFEISCIEFGVWLALMGIVGMIIGVIMGITIK